MEEQLSPEGILRIGTGGWANGVLAAALHLELFTLVQQGVRTADALTGAAQASPRGVQALLDGCVGLGLLSVKDGHYSNSAESAAFLVKNQQSYIGDWIVLHAEDMPGWSRLHEVALSGKALAPASEEFYQRLTPALIPVGMPLAHATVAMLSIGSAGPIHLLDVGGGAGVVSGAWLRANPEAQATQIDAPAVNQVARGFVGSLGVGDRFHTIDGDAASIDWGEGAYDFGNFGSVAHVLSPRQNMEAFRKFHRALRDKGILVITDFVLNDDRSGPPMGLLFTCNMLLHTNHGASYREADYRAWLAEAGFSEVRLERPPGPVAIVLAHK